MSAFTPGPWEIIWCGWGPEDNRTAFAIASPLKESKICGAGSAATEATVVPEDFKKAFTDEEWSKFFRPEEVRANARLIAAAPELYEALKEMLEWCIWDTDYVERAKAALAKAVKP